MEKPTKILFLCMSCREPLFVKQNEIVKNTWGKDILNKKYGDNIDLMFYDGWEKDHFLDKDNHILHVRCEDDGDNTFKKTYYALKLIQNKYDFDYIFRTNTSTYVNVPLALKLIENIEKSKQDDILWASEFLSLVEAPTPMPLNIYGRGNGLLFSRKMINILLNEGMICLYEEKCDDLQIGKILNSYWIKQGLNYLDHIKCYGHGWFRCVEKFEGSNNNRLCEYYNDNSDFEFLKKFITIQIKQYYHRSDEIENYMLLNKSFEGKIDEDIDNTLQKILEYSENPDIFIGSVLGYMTYDYYISCSKQWLWNIECKNKAHNDPFKEIYENKIWY